MQQVEENEEEESGDEHICGACRARFPRYSAFIRHKSLCRLRQCKEKVKAKPPPSSQTSNPEAEAARLLTHKVDEQQEQRRQSSAVVGSVPLRSEEEVEEEEEEVGMQELVEERMEIVTVEESSSVTIYHVRTSRDSPVPGLEGMPK